ncbi:MAG: glycosyltransferase family 39 protein [Anaerolineae bacterium]|nr:glycosyltransferase family 39 protein [Anaerolineae bacterium]
MKKGQWVVLALCLFSFARGVYGLGDQSLWWDESLSHYRATKPFSFILSNRIMIPSGEAEVLSIDNHPPLYFALLRTAILAAGDSEFALRFLSAAAGALIVPLLYLCGVRLFDRWSGVLAALIAALSPFYLWYSQEARPYTLATFLGVLSFYALLRLLDVHGRDDLAHQNARARSAGWGLVYVIAVALMLATHYHTFLLLLAQGSIWLISLVKGRRPLLGWVFGVTLFVAGVMLIWGWSAMPPQSDASGYRFVPLPALLRDVLHAFTLGLSADALVGVRWAAIGLALASTALLMVSCRTPRMHALYVLIGFLGPGAAMFVLSLVHPAYLGSRHLMFASPFYYLLLAGGVARSGHVRLGRRLSLAWPFAGALAVVLAGMSVSDVAYRTDPQYAKEDHRSWGRYLSERIRPDDGVLVIPAPIFDLYEYYVQTSAAHIELPLFGQPAEMTYVALEKWAGQYDRLWVAYSSTPGWANEGNIVLHWLEANARRASLVTFDSPSVVLQAHAFYTRLPVVDALPDGASVIGLGFEDQLALPGLSLPVQGVVSGKSLPLTLYWRAQQPLVRPYRLTLALRDDDGLVWASMDTSPLQGAYPTTQWPVDTLIRDPIDLDLLPGVPPGRYQLVLSVYPSDGGVALAARRLEDGSLQGLIVAIGEVEVVSGGASDGRLPSGVRPARFPDGGLQILGYRYDIIHRIPGDVLALHLYWQAKRTLWQDQSFTVQLVDGSGNVAAARTFAVSSRYPASAWAKGELIWGQYRFRIPATAAAGEYRLYLASGEASGRRRISLGTLAVDAPDESRVFEVPPMQHTLNVNFDDRIELLGYDLDTDTVRPGGVVSYTLYWRALQDIQLDYTVFNHLVAADDGVWGQWDGQPQGGAMPTTRWVPGQVIADPRRVPVAADAPAGPLHPTVGLYDARTMLRLPLRDEQGNVAGDYITLIEVQVRTE